jgi:uncharacterized protein
MRFCRDSCTVKSAPSPTPPDDRIVSLDVLRGVAIFGILIINIRVFAMPSAVQVNPTTYGDFSGVNYAVWLVGHVFAEAKFLTLFSMLFGAGILLFTESKERKGQQAMALHYRRTVWLLVFGLAHAYLFWYGDILVIYAACGLVLVIAREWTARTQAIVGILFLAVTSAMQTSGALLLGEEAIVDAWQSSEAAIQSEVAAYRGGWLDQFDHRGPEAFRRQTTGLVGSSFWRVGGLILIGMSLYRTGVLTGDRSAGFYWRLVAAGLGGIGVILAGVAFIELNDWAARPGLLWLQFNYWASLLVALAYIGLVVLFVRARPAGLVTGACSAIGRTAFSNYILQTVAATTVFYGHGLGWFGQLDRIELLGVVVAIWIGQTVLSVLWLRAFEYGPLEWLWRTLTYGERQPLRS